MTVLVELCAGTAALSLRLHARRGKPPVSRMGNKAGYADAILELLGLRPGQRADHYVWCEPDPGCRLLLGAYADAAVMREAAATLRGWADEDPRALWERLRAEGPLAEWVWKVGHGDPSRPPRLSRIYAAPDGNDLGQWKAPPRDWLARRLETAPTLPATIHPSAFDVPPTPGAVVYIDPPYVGTTGYGHALPRSEVVALARLHAAESLVMVSEAEPVAELVADGWHAVDITSARVGQRRTFSRQQAEWVTMTRPPVRRPGGQGSLFGHVSSPQQPSERPVDRDGEEA